MKKMLGAIAFAAALSIGGGLTSVPAFAQTKPVSATNALETTHAANATDMSARRYHRRYRIVRPFPVYPYGGYPYGYYRRPVVYPYSYTPYPYAYYRPRPVFYRPYPYYAPAPFFRIGFGPRHWW